MLTTSLFLGHNLPMLFKNLSESDARRRLQVCKSEQDEHSFVFLSFVFVLTLLASANLKGLSIMTTNQTNQANQTIETSSIETSSFAFHATAAAAIAAVSLAEITLEVSKKANSSTGRERRVLFVNVPRETITAPEVPDQFRSIVESALSSAASAVLNNYLDSFSSALPSSIPSKFFNRQILLDFISESSSNWMDKESLDAAFSTFTCWTSIISSPNYKASDVYRKAAAKFKEAVLKLSAKNTSIDKKTLQVILARLSDSDAASPAGQFIAERCDKLLKKIEQEDAALDALEIL